MAPIMRSSGERAVIVAPLIPLCLLGTILFAAAATIVLALIPIYLPHRDLQASEFRSSPQQVTLALPSDSNISTGSSLDGTSLANLQTQMQSALTSNSATNGLATVQATSAVAGNSGKRKRRQSGLIANIIVITYNLLFSVRCRSSSCESRVIASSHAIFTRLSIDLSGFSTLSSASNSSSDDEVTGDIAVISQYWALQRPYAENPANAFGIEEVGLPDGCQVEQAQIIHRHGARYPSGTEYAAIAATAAKLVAAAGSFTGPLSFLNTWSFRLGHDTLLPDGAQMEYSSGTNFWTDYGRILYNASVGQASYNGTGLPKPLLRCNAVQRIIDSAVAWASGFFGIYNATSKYSLLIQPVAAGQNSTLASYSSCTNFLNISVGLVNQGTLLYLPLPYYLQNATNRIAAYAPSNINLTVADAFSMQQLCAYEYVALGSSDFCSLFTVNEWKGFQYAFDLFLYNGFSFGQPAGRALGLGLLQEIIARLKYQQIYVSNSSVNSTLDSSPATFPLGQPFYLDMTHDFIIIATLTSMSLDYFHQNLSVTDFPPPARNFQSSRMVPYAARFIIEKIGCVSSNPTATNSTRTEYTPTQYGYSPSAATYKFVRMRLNNGILPINTIRGGQCAAAGRTDGLCPLDNFFASQANISAQSNYAPICFGTYTFNPSQFSGDGNYFPST